MTPEFKHPYRYALGVNLLFAVLIHILMCVMLVLFLLENNRAGGGMNAGVARDITILAMFATLMLNMLGNVVSARLGGLEELRREEWVVAGYVAGLAFALWAAFRVAGMSEPDVFAMVILVGFGALFAFMAGYTGHVKRNVVMLPRLILQYPIQFVMAGYVAPALTGYIVHLIAS